jgi:hypothetical protein
MTTQKLCPFKNSDYIEDDRCDLSNCSLYSEEYKQCSILLISETVASVLKPISNYRLKND